jgi:hypothetical protein
MRRVLPVLLLTVLAPMIAVGCSRQSTHHVGKWRGESSIVGGDEQHFATWNIYEDGTIQVVTESPGPPTVQEGRYKFDYCKNPIQLDINWNDNVTLRGIVQFLGESKNLMHIHYSSSNPGRPTNFEAKDPSWWLMKVK